MFRAAKFVFDAALVSTFIGGIKKSHGIELKTDNIEEPTLRKAAVLYLDLGEYLIDTAAEKALKHPEYFNIRPK